MNKRETVEHIIRHWNDHCLHLSCGPVKIEHLPEKLLIKLLDSVDEEGLEYWDSIIERTGEVHDDIGKSPNLALMINSKYVRLSIYTGGKYASN